MSPFSYQPRLPLGSLILITGVNGLVASHVADQALASGYRVRGTVRSVDKNAWMISMFDSKYNAGRFELVEVTDITADGAFDSAMTGVSGVAHIAALLGSTDPNVMITGSINADLSVLKSATKEDSVKAVVLTSSSWAQSNPVPNKKFNIDAGTWNEWAAEHGYDEPYGDDKLMTVYAASKVLGERECWKYVKENNPGFVFNAVLPAANFGRILSTENQGYPSTVGWVKDLFLGNVNLHPFVPPQYFVDTQDVARLHLAALIDPDLNNERILAYKEPYNWNQLLNIFRNEYTNRKFINDLADQGVDMSTVSTERSEEILRRFGKEEGFTPLTESLRWTVEKLAHEPEAALAENEGWFRG